MQLSDRLYLCYNYDMENFGEKKKNYSYLWKIPIIVLLLSVILFAVSESYRLYVEKKEAASTPPPVDDVPVIVIPDEEEEPPKEIAIPESGILKMTFTTQAPNANWDALHEEACEEASLIMAKHFVKGTTIASAEAADREILDLVSFEEKNGYKVDVTVQQLAEISKSYYGISGTVKTNITVLDIKKEIAKGNPVIIPAAGKILPNPNFRNGGPKYHMLVVKGYDKDGFIANDPGTRKGENFRYGYDAFYNAIHNWEEGDILTGEKAMLVLNK